MAGCWFNIQDSTGTMKVDTRAASFVVVEVPERSDVTVSGRVVERSGSKELDAIGLRY